MKKLKLCRGWFRKNFFVESRLAYEGGSPEGQAQNPDKKTDTPKFSMTLDVAKKDFDAKKTTLAAKIKDYKEDASPAVQAKADEAKAQMDQIDKDAQSPTLDEAQQKALTARLDAILTKYEPEVKEIRETEKAKSDLTGAVKTAMGTDLSQVSDDNNQYEAVKIALVAEIGKVTIPNTVKAFTVYQQDTRGHMWEVKWTGTQMEYYKVDQKGLDDATNKASGAETADKDAVGRARGHLVDAIRDKDDGDPDQDSHFTKLNEAITAYMNDPRLDKKPSDGKGYSVAAPDKFGRVWSVRIDGNGVVTGVYRDDGAVLSNVQKNLQDTRDAAEKQGDAGKEKEEAAAKADLQASVDGAIKGVPLGPLASGKHYEAVFSAIQKAVAAKQYSGVKEFSVVSESEGHKWEVKWNGKGVEITTDTGLSKDLDTLLSRTDREAAGKELAAKLKDTPAYAEVVLSQVFASYSKLPAPRPAISDYMGSFGKDAVAAFQSKMLDKGSDLGKFGAKSDGVDGVLGPVTKKAIEAYYKDQIAKLNAAPAAPANEEKGPKVTNQSDVLSAVSGSTIEMGKSGVLQINGYPVTVSRTIAGYDVYAKDNPKLGLTSDIKGITEFGTSAQLAAAVEAAKKKPESPAGIPQT